MEKELLDTIPDKISLEIVENITQQYPTCPAGAIFLVWVSSRIWQLLLTNTRSNFTS